MECKLGRQFQNILIIRFRWQLNSGIIKLHLFLQDDMDILQDNYHQNYDIQNNHEEELELIKLQTSKNFYQTKIIQFIHSSHQEQHLDNLIQQQLSQVQHLQVFKAKYQNQQNHLKLMQEMIFLYEDDDHDIKLKQIIFYLNQIHL
ncbi:unnamed protein product [Paramecium sonneborni]|uniref:Uncharacterized protein n=1 Tax=Paramecium sonneborni TaxID=65129 RepID=A0A8S1NNS9_9CILI|nr:unnamed protein product [Paramecium sonneborni]